MSDLVRILDELASSAKNDRDKGDKFERLTKFFLENDTRYKDRFSDVWLWNKFPLNEGKIERAFFESKTAFSNLQRRL